MVKVKDDQREDQYLVPERALWCTVLLVANTSEMTKYLKVKAVRDEPDHNF